MLVLALDTSSSAVTADLVDVTADTIDLVGHEQWVGPHGHSEHLTPTVAACLDAAGRTVRDLGAIVVGTGPGPFTGLRVGLVTAAAMAEALGIPAYGVCSLDGLAPRAGAVLVATDARRREVYWAVYADGVRTTGPHVSYPAEVDAGAATAMTGTGARLYADVLGLALLDGEHPSPAVLAEVAAERVRSRAPGDPLTLLYLRRPDAVPPKSLSPQAELVPMTEAHVAQLMKHEHDLFGADSWTPGGYRAEIADRSRAYFALIGPGEEFLGWAGILVAADTAELLTVGVVRSAQRRGHARQMLARLYDEAKSRGARELFLEVRVDNQPAIALYRSEKFEQVGTRRGYYDNGRVDAVVMRRPL